MDILMKYAKKKTIFILSSILSGIITVLYLISKLNISSSSPASIGNIESLAGTIGSMATIIQLIFYLFIIMAVVTAVLSGVYFFKKNKHEYMILGEFIFSCINSVLLLLSISGVNAICKILRITVSGNYSSLTPMDGISMLSSINSAANNLKYFMYLSILLFIFNIFILLLDKKLISINGLTFTFNEEDNVTPIDNNETDTSNEQTVNTKNTAAQPAFDFEKIKAFFKTKNGKITIGVIAAIIVCFGGYKIYDTYFNFTEIDLGKNITAEFDGKDGHGYLRNVKTNIDYDKNNSALSDFVSTTFTDYDYSSDLSNGDKITITVKYSESSAKANKIKVTNDSKTLTVKGLIEEFKNAKALPAKLIEQAKKEADNSIKKRYKDAFSYTYNIEFDSLWLAKEDNSYGDRIGAVYKIDETYTSSFDNSQETKTYYTLVYVDSVDTSYMEDDSHYWYELTLYDNESNRLSDPNGIEEAIKDKFDDYSLEKIK